MAYIDKRGSGDIPGIYVLDLCRLYGPRSDCQQKKVGDPRRNVGYLVSSDRTCHRIWKCNPQRRGCMGEMGRSYLYRARHCRLVTRQINAIASAEV